MDRYLPRILLISIALTLFLISCGGEQPSGLARTPPPSGRPTATDSPSPTPTAGPLPADIVVYPDAQLVVAQRITTGILYFYRSTATLDAVTKFYLDQMPKHGWTQASAELNGAKGSFLVYIKDTRSVSVNIVSDPIATAQTDISITLGNS
ncbi:MAG TPA: hypothetical protein VH599_12760 [Ktedonobacterales bacterium]|jgi:hypothetical protein